MNGSKQTGLTMIEILIAIFIMAVGLLGTATLQVRSLQDTANANLRSQAIYLANDVADRIRSNGAAVTAGYWDDLASAKETAACVTTIGCTTEEMAYHDQSEWMANVAATLPGGEGSLERDGDAFIVTLSWTERVKHAAVADDKTTAGDESKAAAGLAEASITITFEP